jgi:hypothetical protein
MKQSFKEIVLEVSGADALGSQELIQTLWSGYGEILKVELINGSHNSIILKYIDLPINSQHPRGWNTNRSHQRKVKSYDVEMEWYNKWASQCNENCRVPKALACASEESAHLIVLEDLDAAGFPQRCSSLDKVGVKSCLKWLAHFHATFLGEEPTGLWETGSYWHLATRPDELQEMKNCDLKTYAAEIDNKLNSAKYKTFVHGDAKVANFCFSNDLTRVAAVDFQYVGGGCGMKDVAYFLGSCLDENECQHGEKEYLDYYFSELKVAVEQSNKNIHFQELEKEWRYLYDWAWTDFYRFLLGWMPTHYKIHGYTKSLADKVLNELQ